MMDSDLTAEGISYQQSLTFSLQDISIHFPKQNVTSIIGPNGSGKSTLLKVLTNLLSQDKGMVAMGGIEVSKMNAKPLARKRTRLSQVQKDDLDLERKST